MLPIIIKILPIIALFVAGIVLVRTGLLARGLADVLLRLVVVIGLPALILGSLSRIQLTPSLALLPISAMLTILVTGPIAWLIGRRLRLERATLGSFVVGAMIMNLAFEYPFVLLAWGHEGFAYLALLDFGNGLLVLTFVYALACWFGGRAQDWQRVVRSLLAFPPFWALLAALGINAAGIPIPVSGLAALQWLGAGLVLLVPLALGMYFNPRLIRSRALLAAIGLRVGLGLCLGGLWVSLFDLQGLHRSIVMLGTAAPVGFNTLVYASLEGLDREFAASMASVSLLLALVYLPVFIYLLS